MLLPLAVTAIWGAIARNPLLPLGYFGTLPWLALNMFAVHPAPGTLSFYYGFPFWLALAWPLIALAVWRRSDGSTGSRWPYALVLLVSLVGWQRDRVVIYPLWHDARGASPFFWNETLANRARYQQFVDYFLAHSASLGAIMLDQAVGGLLTDHVDRRTWTESFRSGSAPDAMIYFPFAFEWRTEIQPRLRSGGYPCVYELPGHPHPGGVARSAC